jgi:hypothetical protein
VSNNSDQKKFKLDPKEYKEKLGSVDLKSICLDSFSAVVNRDKLGSSMKTTINDKRKYEIKENGDVVFLHSFELINTTKSKKDYGIKISCSYSLCFRSKLELSSAFWDIFLAVNLHINTWPYFREFVQNTTQRMSVYPLTLPLIK